MGPSSVASRCSIVASRARISSSLMSTAVRDTGSLREEGRSQRAEEYQNPQCLSEEFQRVCARVSHGLSSFIWLR